MDFTTPVFDPANLKTALDALPKEEITLAVEAKEGDAGAVLEANKSLGKGAFVEADASWMRKAGWKVAAMIGWRKG